VDQTARWYWRPYSLDFSFPSSVLLCKINTNEFPIWTSPKSFKTNG
jgi:hypothetical protein